MSELPPSLDHLGHVLRLAAKTGVILYPVRLRAHDKSLLGIVEHQMSNIWMGAEDSIHGYVAGVARHGKFVADIVHQFVCFVVDLLFRNSQDLAEVTLDGCLNRAVALNSL